MSTDTLWAHQAVNSSPMPGLPSGTARAAPVLAAACTPARLPLSVPSGGAPAEPPTCDDGERFAAHVAHELRTPVTLQRALVRHSVTGGRIEIATRTEAEHAVLSVANTGRLIPADELPRLFQPFQRLSSQPRGCAHGVGLGLAIVQAIADAHDAIVAAHPRAGGGLTVDIRFPATIDTACARSGEQLRPTTGP